jgi:Ca2+-binding EF-hand superfamily protein
MSGPHQLRLAAVLLAVLAVGCPAARAEDDPQGPAAALGGPGGPVATGLVKHYDRDGNGQLDLGERQAAAADMLKRFDRNRNGRLDPDEQTAALVELGARHPSAKQAKQTEPQSLERRLVERFDEDHDGRLDESERKRALKQLNRAAPDRATNRLRTETLRRLDADGNGRLDSDELDGFVDPPTDGADGTRKKATDQRPDRSATTDREN